MKTKYKFIHMEENVLFERSWNICNNKSGNAIGFIEWYVEWKKYVFQSNGTAVFSIDCLEDIIHFIKQLEGR